MECKLVNLMDTIHVWLEKGRHFVVDTPYIDFSDDDAPHLVFELYETLADGKFIATYPSEIVWEDFTAETLKQAKLLFPDFRADARKPYGG